MTNSMSVAVPRESLSGEDTLAVAPIIVLMSTNKGERPGTPGRRTPKLHCPNDGAGRDYPSSGWSCRGRTT